MRLTNFEAGSIESMAFDHCADNFRHDPEDGCPICDLADVREQLAQPHMGRSSRELFLKQELEIEELKRELTAYQIAKDNLELRLANALGISRGVGTSFPGMPASGGRVDLMLDPKQVY